MYPRLTPNLLTWRWTWTSVPFVCTSPMQIEALCHHVWFMWRLVYTWGFTRVSNRPASPAMSEIQGPSRHWFRSVIAPNRIHDGVHWVASLGHLCTTTGHTVPASPAVSLSLLVWGELQELDACHSPDYVCLVEACVVLRMLFSAGWTRRHREICHAERKLVGWKRSLIKWTARYGFVGWHRKRVWGASVVWRTVWFCCAPLLLF